MTPARGRCRGYKSVVAAVSATQFKPSMLAGDTPASTEYHESPMSALVKLVDVSKRYAGATALHSTNLSVERGKATVLIGPSGCGKSTLLRLIIRLIEPDSGLIEFNGEPITAENINVLRRRIGYVIQEGGLFPHLTARANALLMAPHIAHPHDVPCPPPRQDTNITTYP